MADKTLLVCDMCRDTVLATARYSISGIGDLDLCDEHNQSFLAFIGSKATAPKKRAKSKAKTGKNSRGTPMNCPECGKGYRYPHALEKHRVEKHRYGLPPAKEQEQPDASDTAAA